MIGKAYAHLQQIATVFLAGVVGLIGLFLGFYIFVSEEFLIDVLFPGNDRTRREKVLDRMHHAGARRVDEWLGEALVRRAASGEPFTLDEVLPAPAVWACLETQRWPNPPENPARDLARRSERKAYWLDAREPTYSMLAMERADKRVMAHRIDVEGWPWEKWSEVRFQFAGLDRAVCGVPRDIVLLPQPIESTMLLAVQPLVPVIDVGNARGALRATDVGVAIALTRQWIEGGTASFTLRDIVREPFESACLQTWHWGPPDAAAKNWMDVRDMPWMWRYEGSPTLALRRADGSARIYRIGEAHPRNGRARRLAFDHGGGRMWGRTCSSAGNLIFERRPAGRGQVYEFTVRAE